jgi:putative hydrolase of the HAD superfamily
VLAVARAASYRRIRAADHPQRLRTRVWRRCAGRVCRVGLAAWDVGFRACSSTGPGCLPLFLSKWADPRGQDLYRRLELGEITQQDWNEGFGALLGISPENLMERVLYDMFPAYDVMRVAREARAAGVRVAMLSNSLGREPFDPYAPYHLRGNFDAVILSAEHGIRKPDPAIFTLALDRLGLPPGQCVFADDTEENLLPAYQVGMAVTHAVDEQVTAAVLRELLELPGGRPAG